MADFIEANIASVVLAFFAVILLTLGALIVRKEEQLIRESKRGTGLISKYWTEDYHKGVRPYITFDADGSLHTVRAQEWVKDEDQKLVGTIDLFAGRAK